MRKFFLFTKGILYVMLRRFCDNARLLWFMFIAPKSAPFFILNKLMIKGADLSRYSHNPQQTFYIFSRFIFIVKSLCCIIY